MKKIILILLIFICGCAKEPQRITNEKIRVKREEQAYFVVGESYTEIKDKEENRLENISLACASTTETALMPGEVFSFNEKTGKRSIARGYKEASVIISGEKSRGIGGGVCQVSTTIYMAAINCGLEVIEVHHHSLPVSYAPQNTDAAVVYGYKDLKIKNNTNDAVILYTWTDNEKIFAKFVRKDPILY